MSHIVEITTEVRDGVAVADACKAIPLAPPVAGRHQLFAGIADGLAVYLPGWTYPVVCDTSTGKLSYDNFGGRWGDPAHLERFLQGYAVAKVKLEARRAGHRVREQKLGDGSVRLTLTTGVDPCRRF